MKFKLNPTLYTALAVLSVVGLTTAGCAKSAGTGDIKFGEYSSLTGTTATFGQSTHKGLELAVAEINAAGGIDGRKIKLITEDTQSKPEEAVTAVNKLIHRDKVDVVIGEVASSRTLAAAPICQTNQVPMVSPASTNPDVTKKGDYIFRVCFIDPYQGSVLATFATKTLKANRVAVLKDVRNDYSIGLTTYFKKTLAKLGGSVVAEQAYGEGDTDFKAQLTAIKAANPQVVFVPGYYTEVALIVKQARELNITVPFIGGDGWDSSKLIEVGGDAMNGCYYSNHYSADSTDLAVQAFVKKFQAQYKETPDALAALGYDAGKIVASAIKRAGTADKTAVRDMLADTKDFAGVTGKITIDKDRNAAKSAVIVAIKHGKVQFQESVSAE